MLALPLRWQQYTHVIKLSFLDMMEYRFDFAMHILKYSFAVIFTAFLWLAVVAAQGNQLMSPAQVIAYFGGAAIIYSLSNFHPYYIEDDIRLGNLSKFLVRPTHPFLFYFAFESTIGFVEMGVRVLVVIPILISLGIVYHPSPLQLLLFLCFLPLIFFTAFTIFWMISTGAFWVQEVFAIRWSLTITFRLLSGMLVPIVFFPSWLQHILFWLPFEHFVHTPLHLLDGSLSLINGVQGFVILLLWAIILSYVRWQWWRLGVAQYEGTGI